MYFANFPLIPYDSVGNGNYKLVTNLMKRVALRSKVRTNALLFDTYDVKEGETPEMIAARAQEGLAQAEIMKAQNAEDKNNIDLIGKETDRIKVVGDLEAKGIELQRKDLESKMTIVQSMQPKAM